MIGNFIIDFLTAAPFWELILIIVAKAIEVTMATLRIILISKGYRKPGTILSFFEVLLWVIIASFVISNIAEAPIKAIAYSLGFAIGVYSGSLLESYFALGKLLVYINCESSHKEVLAEEIRKAGYGVTTIDAEGKDSCRVILMIFTNRKGHQDLINLAKALDSEVMITAHEVSVLKGGFITPWRRIHK